MKIGELQKIAKAMEQSIIDVKPFIEAGKKIADNFGGAILKLSQQFDFSRLDEYINEIHDNVLSQSAEMIQENIFPNIDLLKTIGFDEMDDKYNAEWVLQWMYRNLDNKVHALVSDEECFGATTTLISQSYESYKSENYAVGFIALYPVIDAFVSHWDNSKDGSVVIKGGKLKSIRKNRKDEIKLGHQGFIDSLDPVEGYAFDILYGMYALRAFTDVYSEGGHRGFQRHHAMHGSLDYSIIQKEDYVKLFFFLYAVYHLKGISKSEVTSFNP